MNLNEVVKTVKSIAMFLCIIIAAIGTKKITSIPYEYTIIILATALIKPTIKLNKEILVWFIVGGSAALVSHDFSGIKTVFENIFFSPTMAKVVSEELLFRGVFLRKMSKTNLAIQSFLFAIMHRPETIETALIFSISAGLLYHKKNILLPIMLHLGWNIIAKNSEPNLVIMPISLFVMLFLILITDKRIKVFET